MLREKKAPKATECASEEVKPGESELLELKRKNKATMSVTIFAKYKADKVALTRRKAGEFIVEGGKEGSQGVEKRESGKEIRGEAEILQNAEYNASKKQNTDSERKGVNGQKDEEGDKKKALKGVKAKGDNGAPNKGKKRSAEAQEESSPHKAKTNSNK